MENRFSAIYENGTFIPLSKIDFKEKQKVDLKVIPSKSVVQTTKGLIKGNTQYLRDIAESKELDEWNL
jgi:predicted DNA-binding antitoxin AbrB/MazE fold protein